MKNSNTLSLVLVIGIFIVIGCSCPRLNELKQSSSDRPGTSSTDNTDFSNSKGGGGGGSNKAGSKTALSMEKYNQIKNGMSYKQVAEILGSEGVETMSSGEGKYKVTSYKWEGEDFQFITCVFMGDKMTSKVQANLK
ncbi:MAG: DUF3862 domain-containing protein [Acidobacteriota bacterium]|nr:DUF3862 domain-containing protein [Acidobacteriota bacterium]